MSKKITDAEWRKYAKEINDFHNDAFQDEVQWLTPRPTLPSFGEDRVEPGKIVTVLRGLFYYNYFRTWPITAYAINGEYDKQSEVLLLNIDYLRKEGVVNEHDQLNYKPEDDHFIHRGITYVATGDSFISQAKGTPLLFMLILKRLQNVEKLQI